MKSRFGAGLVAGIIAGIIFGIIELFFHATLADGTVVPDLNLAARVLHQTSMGAAWLWQIVGTAILGGIYGLIFSNKTATMKSALGWGLLYGIVWWIISGLIITPAAAKVPVGQIAVAGLVGWVIYGLIEGALFRSFFRAEPIREAARTVGEKVGMR